MSSNISNNGVTPDYSPITVNHQPTCYIIQAGLAPKANKNANKSKLNPFYRRANKY